MATAKKSSKITLFNPSAMPVVYTGDGRVIGGGERIEVERLDTTGETVVKEGYLINETERDSATSAKDGASDQDAPA